MKFLKLLVSVIIVFIAQNILAQEKGSLFLSSEILRKNALSFGIEQPYVEFSQADFFSTSNWKYNQGDDLSWKDATFDDSNWKLFHTDFNLDSIQKGDWQGIGWFRLKLIIDSSLFNQQLALVMTHFGASEIYLDGNLINQYGVPSKDPAIEKPYRPLNLDPVILPLNDHSEHMLAVRYSFLQANMLFEKFEKWRVFKDVDIRYAGFMTHFGNAKESMDLFSYSLIRNLLLAFITFIALFLIGSFHASLSLFYSRDRTNLYLAIFNYTIAGFVFARWLPTYTHLSLQAAMIDSIFVTVFWEFWLPVSMLAYYSVFYKKLPKFIWLYFAGIPLLLYDWLFNSSISFEMHKWIMYIAFLDMLRLLIRSVLKKERNTWIIGIGVLLSQFAWILYLNPSIDIINREFLAYCILLTVPVALLVFNGSRTAGINISLEKQLEEVQRLSNLSLLKEREKQQILTSQKSMLEQQVEHRTAELNKSLKNLQSAQSQLIQSEKMASLGELTAGIAHEIQNPLNFVNNFSEVNMELISELKEGIEKGKLDEAKAIADDITVNEQKINFHGKRADAIVKGMLQHSRNSSGIKDPTDINKLADEYLRLAFHGLRAKNKSFNADFRTELDESLPKINVIPQDIGRVLLNLINNAFHAVTERAKQGEDGYKPEVVVSTKKLEDKIEIRVKDNGNGIPPNVIDKIFQPFFTTKPTGEGTGLGLSLSYDIITNGYGGELKVETKEGEGTELIIQLPV